jgi:hypothetical protein
MPDSALAPRLSPEHRMFINLDGRYGIHLIAGTSGIFVNRIKHKNKKQ